MTLRSLFFQALANFLGSVFAAAFVGLVGYLAWRILRFPGFRVGASWSFTGWDLRAMGRFPNQSDSNPMRFIPNISVTSYDDSVKKIIHSIWVRERADPVDPGKIWGHRDLQREEIPPEIRTTGGDPLRIDGPVISGEASLLHTVINCPIFVETSDGSFYRAESVGNAPSGPARFRYRCKNALYAARRQYAGLKSLVRRKTSGRT